jgi:diaminopimelate epimerase
MKKYIPFHKYQGSGNDFILVDNRGDSPWIERKNTILIKSMCDRHFGIGADGLMLLQAADGFDFEMVYFNSDGCESTLCGNGGRCIAAFAQQLAIFDFACRFLAVDGAHKAILPRPGYVELQMSDVLDFQIRDGSYILHTGSPHFVKFVENMDSVDIVKEGRAIRYAEPFLEAGINVNFVEVRSDGIHVATYERGVEDETLSCGTGVTAAAMAYALACNSGGHHDIPVKTKGGTLEVRFDLEGGNFNNVWLCGPAREVFFGNFPL